MKIECEGTCNLWNCCGDSLYRVRVESSQSIHNWGDFWYCEVAIATDNERDLFVTVLGEYIAR